jgi:AhpD family alkylhydroperoxidase
MMLKARTNVYPAWLDGYRSYARFSKTIVASGLEQSLLHLVFIRASQINGCAYCCDMHTREAHEAGEKERRLHTVAAWRDAPWFSDQERAALGLTEAVTRLEHGDVPDETVDEALRLFGEDAFAKLLWAIVVVNGWNRVNVTAHVRPPR